MAQNYNTLVEFTNALDNAYANMGDVVTNALRNHVPTLVELIKLRVSTKGQKADGGQFSTPYSRSHTYKRKKYGKGLLGTQISHKGFFYQGTMWDNFKSIINGNKAKLGFEGSNLYTSNDHLGQIHSDRENISIVAANPDEARQLTRLIGKEIGDYLKSVL